MKPLQEEIDSIQKEIDYVEMLDERTFADESYLKSLYKKLHALEKEAKR